MAEKLTECSCLIPIHPDNVAEPVGHSLAHWEWLLDETWSRFGGGTAAPGLYSGFYADVDSGDRISDESRNSFVAIAPTELDKLRGLLMEACDVFQQKCIYLNVGGEVEFVYRIDLMN